MDTIQIYLPALEWLSKHSTLTYEDIVFRCDNVPRFRMAAILKSGQPGVRKYMR